MLNSILKVESTVRLAEYLLKNHLEEGSATNVFTSAPEASPCIIRPELCEAHLGKGRDPEWEEKHHNRPHYVLFGSFLRQSKLVLPGKTKFPTRWIDQGASYAIKLAKVPYRKLAGDIEVALKDIYTDKNKLA